MEFTLEARVVLTLENKKGMSRSKHISTDFNLNVSDNLDKTQYLENDLPTKEGFKVLSNILIQGLVGNIHQAHERGFRNDAEHLRWVISELERGFVAIAEVGVSTFKD